MLEGKVGCGIISFDRPDYLRQLLASLEGQTCLDETDFHLFQDGPVNEFSGRECARGDDVAACVDVFAEAHLPTAYSHVRQWNVGIGIHQFQAVERMVAEYDHVLMLEDDVVLSPHYLRLVRVLFEQLEDRRDVFGFCLGFKKLCAKHKTGENLDKIFETCGHWWAEAFWADRWERMFPHFMEFHRLIEGVDYMYRPHKEIVALFRRKGWPSPVSSQDVAKDMAISAAGMVRVRTVVNRAISVGEHGMNFTPRGFRKLGFHDQEPFVFEEDAILQKFEWRK